MVSAARERDLHDVTRVGSCYEDVESNISFPLSVSLYL